MLASILEKDLVEHIKTDTVGVFYLGDLDSFVLASSASQVNNNIVLYVFTIDGDTSEYVKNAEKVADLMEWSIRKVDIRTKHFISQIKKLLGAIEVTQKRDLAFYYAMMECLSEVSEAYLLCGAGLDAIGGLSKIYQKEHRANPARFHSTRLDYLASDPTPTTLQRLEDEFGKVICAPFLTFRRTSEYFMSRDWRQLNVDEKSGRVMLKASLRDAYHDRIKRRGLIATYTDAFKTSGLDKLVNEILKSKAINFNSRRRLIELFVDWRLRRIGKQRLEQT